MKVFTFLASQLSSILAAYQSSNMLLPLSTAVKCARVCKDPPSPASEPHSICYYTYQLSQHIKAGLGSISSLEALDPAMASVVAFRFLVLLVRVDPAVASVLVLLFLYYKHFIWTLWCFFVIFLFW